MSRADDRAERKAERDLEEKIYGPGEAERREQSRRAVQRGRRLQEPSSGGPVLESHDGSMAGELFGGTAELLARIEATKPRLWAHLADQQREQRAAGQLAPGSLEIAETKWLVWWLFVQRPDIGEAQSLGIVEKALGDARRAGIDRVFVLREPLASSVTHDGLGDDPLDPRRFIDLSVAAWDASGGPSPSPTRDLLEELAEEWNTLEDRLQGSPTMQELAIARRYKGEGARSSLWKEMGRQTPKITKADVIGRAAELRLETATLGRDPNISELAPAAEVKVVTRLHRRLQNP